MVLGRHACDWSMDGRLHRTRPPLLNNSPSPPFFFPLPLIASIDEIPSCHSRLASDLSIDTHSILARSLSYHLLAPLHRSPIAFPNGIWPYNTTPCVSRTRCLRLDDRSPVSSSPLSRLLPTGRSPILPHTSSPSSALLSRPTLSHAIPRYHTPDRPTPFDRLPSPSLFRDFPPRMT